ncbi:MAG: hypothetical protein V1858_03175 [Candidatus Gottesmanbacteria bacterium]
MSETEILLGMAEVIAGSLKNKLVNKPEIQSVAFYSVPPTRNTDLDILIVRNNDTPELNDILQQISSLHKIPVDTWILSPEQLTLRMKRIAGVGRGKPKIFEKIAEWKGFGFVPITGSEFLKKTIENCYSQPEPGGPIPPTPEEHIQFTPK